jgi:hypothetical protein
MKLASGPHVEPIIHFNDNGNSINGIVTYPGQTMSIPWWGSHTSIVMIRITENEYLGSYWTGQQGPTCRGLVYVKKGGLGIETEFQGGYQWAADYTDDRKKNMIVIRQMSTGTDATEKNLYRDQNCDSFNEIWAVEDPTNLFFPKVCPAPPFEESMPYLAKQRELCVLLANCFYTRRCDYGDFPQIHEHPTHGSSFAFWISGVENHDTSGFCKNMPRCEWCRHRPKDRQGLIVCPGATNWID